MSRVTMGAGNELGSPFFVALSASIVIGIVYCLDMATGAGIVQAILQEVRFF